jgi:CheY-like chemotaxis protein
VRIAPGRVEQILLNLVVNARDAMPDGGSIDIRVHPCADATDAQPGEWVVLSVADEGRGMDATVLQRAFDPFFTTKPDGVGTGLGLATVRSIAMRAGGRVTATSTPGAGSLFHVYLPVTTEPAGLPVTPDPPAPRGARILLVEDQESLRALLREVLEEHGYRVLDAPDAESALATAANTPGIDVVVTDIVLPGMNGYALARQLASRRHATTFIYMSGYSGDAAAPGGGAPPPGRFLQKPFEPECLLLALREVTARAEAAQ